MSKVKDWLEQDKLTLLEGWARDGLTDEQIAKNMGINRTTLIDWKKKYVDISNTLKKGKEVVDFEVENALLKRALGYDYKEETYEDGVLKKVVTKHMAPDTTAQIFWLKNRKPDKWRDKVIDVENEEAIKNASDIIVKIRKTVYDRYKRD